MIYPPLSPDPLIDWGPGTARLNRYDTWLPGDTALQFEYFGKTGDGDTIAQLTIHAYNTPHSPSVSIELTRGDIIELLNELMKAHHSEYHAENGD